MSLSLPLSSSPLREMFEVVDLIDYKKIPTFRNCINSSRSAFSDKKVRSVNYICLRANGEIWMIKVGPKGGWSKLWNFGNPLTQ